MLDLEPGQCIGFCGRCGDTGITDTEGLHHHFSLLHLVQQQLLPCVNFGLGLRTLAFHAIHDPLCPFKSLQIRCPITHGQTNFPHRQRHVAFKLNLLVGFEG